MAVVRDCPVVSTGKDREFCASAGVAWAAASPPASNSAHTLPRIKTPPLAKPTSSLNNDDQSIARVGISRTRKLG
jgi:hypothetical protein